ncbi:MAG: WXG100 family type VII secretion target [Lachnospiraceae bacterium]
MSKIHVTPSQLKRIASEIKEIEISIVNDINKMNQIGTTIESAWKSQSSNIYLREFHKVKNDFNEIVTCMDSLVQVQMKEVKDGEN